MKFSDAPFEPLAPFPPKPDFWREALARRDARPVPPWGNEERAEIAEFNRRVGMGAATLENIETLGNPLTLAVVAGQQAGLFASPLFVLYKALGAVKWAEELARLLDRPVAPIFWIASDDHDFDEVRHARYLDRQGRLVRWSYAPEAFASDADEDDDEKRLWPGVASIFDIPAERLALETFLSKLETDTHDTEFKGPLLERWREHIVASENLEDFFGRAMADLLGATGLILAPSRLGAIRRRAVEIVKREIDEPCVSARLTRDAAEAWKKRGDEPPLHRRGNEANFFLYRGTIRCKVTVDDDHFLLQRPDNGDLVGRLDAEELRRDLAESPERFSPNVITRPAVQDAAFPTLAMLGGPGEARYLALLSEAGVYAHFDVPAAVVLPRPRALLVEPRIARQLAKRGIDDALLAEDSWESIERALERAGDFGPALGAIEELADLASGAFDRLPERLGPLGERPSVASAVAKTGKAWAQSVERLESRLRAEIKREQEAGEGQLERLRDALRPEGQPQERLLGPLAPFLLNHGPGFVSWLIDNLRIDTDRLQIIRPGGAREKTGEKRGKEERAGGV